MGVTNLKNLDAIVISNLKFYILTFYNENEQHLLCALNKLNNQIYSSRIQVIVIDDGSTNNVIAKVKDWISKNELKHDFHMVERAVNGGRKAMHSIMY